VTAAPACPRISSIHSAIPRDCKSRLVRDIPSPRGFPPPVPLESLSPPDGHACARDTPFAALARRAATLVAAPRDVAVPVYFAESGGKTPHTRLGFPWPIAPGSTTADTQYTVADSSFSAKPAESLLEPSVSGRRPSPHLARVTQTDSRHRGARITKAPIGGSLLGRR